MVAVGSTVDAQDDDDELPPGLLAEYTAAGQTVKRIDGDIAFDWRTGSPDLQLPAGPFQARWSGKILLRAEGRYRWHAYLQGRVTVRVDNRILLEAKAEEPRWISGEETELSFGEFPLTVEFDSSGNSRLMLCWSSDQFPLEPLPHHVLFHERSDVPQGSLPPGAIAVLNHRCDRCHGQIAGLISPPGPSLVHICMETSPDWLIDRIQHGGGNRGAMPSFGFTRDEAAAILAALETDAKPVELPPTSIPEQLDAKDVAAGRELLASVGCLACHEWNQQGRRGEFAGPLLDDVAQHRTARWLETWLSDPAKLNAQHRMPMFALSADERRQIISALVSVTDHRAVTQEKASPKLETVRLGHKLIYEARCANCHELPGPQRAPAPPPRWTEMKLDGSGCWDDSPTGRRPKFIGLNTESLSNFLTAAKQDIKPAVDLMGSLLLVEKGCVNCHDRDGRKGISALAAALAKSAPSLEGRAPWLIPPQLTAVGDRLSDERLAKAIRGELPERRLDWLLVRMPRYQHADAEQTSLMAHLVGHDRIPEDAPATPEYPQSGKQEMTQAGRELIGGKGFSCVACHPVKDFTPKQIALGTRGSNLFMIRDRLRPEYFFRWTRSPLRVMPGVEMPSYQRPHAQIFPGDLNRQLAAIWTALNDPDLPTPVNPGAVEQYWTVGPNDPPRILRDVVTLPGKKDVTVPRAFAVGFPNGHNILFDLDTASVRAWTVGDFAQQRTQGKSWYWDLVGTPVMVNEKGESDLLVLSHETKTVLFPSHGATVRLLRIENVGNKNGVIIAYELEYQLPKNIKGPQTKIGVRELWRPTETGWTRNLVASCNEDGRFGQKGGEFAELYLLEPPVDGNSRGVKQLRTWHSPEAISPIDKRRGHQIMHNPHGLDRPAQTFQYTCETKVVSAAPPDLTKGLTAPAEITVVPGFHGQRLPYPTTIMPTAMTFNHRGQLLFTSLKGHVYSADDQEAKLFAEGLAAPFGILDSHDMVIVSHKPEIVGLVDEDDDGRADQFTVIASGWGFTDDYHDWTCGLVRDAEGNLFTALGSDYAQKGRPAEKSLWRGHALKIDPSGKVESVARGLRFPTGVAMTSEQHVFITDQQGVQNTFNELNWLQPGARYGVPSLHEPDKDAPATPPAVQIPHPWTRSVNGICAIPKPLADRTHPKLFDQLLGCEYDNRFLVRFSWQLVDGVMQGGVYPFCKPSLPGDQSGFLGPLSIAVSPDGELYVGSIHDSGWQGGLNTGDIVKLTPDGTWPNGLCEIRATPSGFDLEFFRPVDKARAEDKSRYQISGYTRVWQGSYATPDSGRHNADITAAKLNDAGDVVSLTLSGLKPGHVYDVSIGDIGSGEERALWPNVGYYTLHRVPK